MHTLALLSRVVGRETLFDGEEILRRPIGQFEFARAIAGAAELLAQSLEEETEASVNKAACECEEEEEAVPAERK